MSEILQALLDKFLGLARHGWAEIERPIPDEWAYLDFDKDAYSEARYRYSMAIRSKKYMRYHGIKCARLAPCAEFFRLRYGFLVSELVDTAQKLAQIDPVWATQVVLIRDKDLRVDVARRLNELGVFPAWFKREHWRAGIKR